MSETKDKTKEGNDYAMVEDDFLVSHHPEEKKYKIPRVRDMEDSGKPREKMSRLGVSELTQQELMAVVLGVGTKKEEVMEMSTRIIKEYGHRSVVDQRDPEKLSQDLDIPSGKACQIVACFELGRRAFSTKETGLISIRTPKEVYDYLKDMRALPKEHLRGLYLNSRYQIIHDEVISVGTATENLVHPREIFRPAIEYGAIALILAHNHPSGTPTPTESDLLTTQQMVGVGKMLGISLLDHIVITKDQYMSVPIDY